MDIYLAARHSRKEELRGYAAQLLELGYGVTSRWLLIDETEEPRHANGGQMPTEDRAQYAGSDLYDVRRADILVLFTEDGSTPPPRGNGRFVEFGYALGRHKEVFVVGPLENLFCCIPKVLHFDNWRLLHGWLRTNPFDRHGNPRRVADVPSASPGTVQ